MGEASPSSVVRGRVRGEASPAIAQNAVALYGPFGLPALPPRAASWRRRRRGRGAKRRSAGGGTALGPDSRQFRGDDDSGASLKAGRARGLLPRQRPE